MACFEVYWAQRTAWRKGTWGSSTNWGTVQNQIDCLFEYCAPRDTFIPISWECSKLMREHQMKGYAEKMHSLRLLWSMHAIYAVLTNSDIHVTSPKCMKKPEKSCKNRAILHTISYKCPSIVQTSFNIPQCFTSIAWCHIIIWLHVSQSFAKKIFLRSDCRWIWNVQNYFPVMRRPKCLLKLFSVSAEGL